MSISPVPINGIASLLRRSSRGLVGGCSVEKDISDDVPLEEAAGLVYREDSFNEIFYARQKQAGGKGVLQTLPNALTLPGPGDNKGKKEDPSSPHDLPPADPVPDDAVPARKGRKELVVGKDQMLQGLGVGEPPVAEVERNRPQLVEELLSSRKHHKDDDPIIVNKTDFFKKIKHSGAGTSLDRQEVSSPLSPEGAASSRVDKSAGERRQSSSIMDAKMSASSPTCTAPMKKRKNSSGSITTDILLQNTEAFMSSLSGNNNASRAAAASAGKLAAEPTRESVKVPRPPVSAPTGVHNEASKKKPATKSSRIDELFASLPPAPASMSTSLTLMSREKGAVPPGSAIMSKSFGDTNNNTNNGAGYAAGSNGSMQNSSQRLTSAGRGSRHARSGVPTARPTHSRSNSADRNNSVNAHDRQKLRQSNGGGIRTPREPQPSPGLTDSLKRGTGGSGKKVGAPSAGSGTSSARPNRTFELRRARNDGGGDKGTPLSARSTASSAQSASSVSATPRRSGGRTHSAERSEVSLGARIVAKSRENTASSGLNSASSFKRGDGGRHSLRVSGTSTGVPSVSSASAKKSPGETARVAEKKAWQRRKSYDPRKAVADAKAKSRSGTSTLRAGEDGVGGDGASAFLTDDELDPTVVDSDIVRTRERGEEEDECGGEAENGASEGRELEIAMFSSELAKDLELLSRGDEELAVLGGDGGMDTERCTEIQSPLQLINEVPIAKEKMSNCFASAATMGSHGQHTRQHDVTALADERRANDWKEKGRGARTVGSGVRVRSEGTPENPNDSLPMKGEGGRRRSKYKEPTPGGVRLRPEASRLLEESKSPLSNASSGEIAEALASTAPGPVPPLTLHRSKASPLDRGEDTSQNVLHKSAFSSFSDQSVSPPNSPALSPVRAKFCQSQPRLSSSSSGSPKTPGLGAGGSSMGTSTQSYNSVILSSIQQISLKLKATTARTVSQVTSRSPEPCDTPSPTEDLLLSQGEDFPASQELAEILRTLRVVDHNVKALERHLYHPKSDSKSSLTDFSTAIGSDDQGQYLAEIKRIRNEITSFKPIEPLAAGGQKKAGGGVRQYGSSKASSAKPLAYSSHKKAYY